MVIDRVRLLTSGREITLPIVPVDPRDLFRGEYVRLGYDIGSVPARLLDGPRPRAQRGLLRRAGEEARRRLAARQDVARHAAARPRPTASC